MNMDVLKVAIENLPNIAIAHVPEILKLGKDGVEYLQKLLEISNLSAKNKKEETKKYLSYAKIGKLIYESKVKINNSSIKDEIKKISNCDEIIKSNNKKIEEKRIKIKNNEAYKDAREIYDGVGKEIQSLKVKKTNKKSKKTSKKK